MDVYLNAASDSDDEYWDRPGAGGRPPPAPNPNRVPLQQFLRLIAGGRMMDHGRAASNDELVASLCASGVVSTQAVSRAMRICRRDAFVVERYRDEAFADMPIRVEEMGFNISAPHMHASCLEALALKPGAAVLDVGCGCGVIAACAAVIVGRSGSVVGIDVRRECVQLSRDNITQLAALSPEFAAAAAACTIEVGNCFITNGTLHRGRYDCVHVGASCPPSALPPLLSLLKPGGGTMVVPVAPSDLRVIVKKANGAITQKVISQVRFSDLEVPRDAEVVLATLRMERKVKTAPPQVASTFDADAAAIAAAAKWRGGGTTLSLSSSPVGVINGMPHSPSAASSSSGATPSTTGSKRLAPDVVGDPDCSLVGMGWEIPVHSAVLRQRCDHFRARSDSGMRDAALSVVHLPPHFLHPAAAALVKYLYTDEADFSDCHLAAEVLHLAQYYGVPRLAHLVEVALAKALKRSAKAADKGAAEAAAELLALADEQSLWHLRSVALDTVITHHEEVSRTDGYAALTRDQLALVAAEACRLHATTQAQLQELCNATRQELPDP